MLPQPRASEPEREMLAVSSICLLTPAALVVPASPPAAGRRVRPVRRGR